MACLSVACGLLGVLPQSALAGDMGTLYGQLGTNGWGLGYGLSVSDNWAVRGQANAFKQSYSGSVSDISASGQATVEINLSSVQLLGDWYPGSMGFRLTGGVVLNDNKITLSGTGNINGKTAAIDGAIKMGDGVTPYLGVGYSSRPRQAKGLGFVLDVGVMLQNPKITLTTTDPSVTQADIDAQLAKVQDAVSPLRTMPVLALGLSYSF